MNSILCGRVGCTHAYIVRWGERRQLAVSKATPNPQGWTGGEVRYSDEGANSLHLAIVHGDISNICNREQSRWRYELLDSKNWI